MEILHEHDSCQFAMFKHGSSTHITGIVTKVITETATASEAYEYETSRLLSVTDSQFAATPRTMREKNVTVAVASQHERNMRNVMM